MKFVPTSIQDVLIVEPTVFADERGFFMEAFHRQRYADVGIQYDFVHENKIPSRLIEITKQYD